MNIRISVNSHLRRELLEHFERAVKRQSIRLTKRILVILDVLDGVSWEEAAQRLALDLRTVEEYVIQFILHGMASLAYKRPPGRPPKL